MKTIFCIISAFSVLVLAPNGASAKPRSKAEVLAILRAQRVREQVKLQHDQSTAATSPTQDDLFRVQFEKMQLAVLDKSIHQYAYEVVHHQHRYQQ